VPNLSITRRCRRNCSFCFAAHERGREGVLDMTRDDYEDALAFLERSQVPDVRILGGEPTEHPAFAEFVDLAVARGLRPTVFTGGLMPDEALDYLGSVPAGRVTVVLNTALPGVEPDAWIEAQERVCSRLGPRVEPGVTLTTSTFRPDFLLDLVERYGLRRRVRLGMAHPIWGGRNQSLHSRAARAAGRMLERFIEAAEEAEVEVDLDCGFTPCMFSRGFLETHALLAESVGTRCNTIVDILPEGDAIACYALSRFLRLPLTNRVTRDELVSIFDGEVDRLIPEGAYKECAWCEYRAEGRCGGGCRARRALRLRPDTRARLVEE
jgi:radical SAM protein with 4Fe4S-binding SPASM domain